MIRKYETMWDEGELPTYESVNHCQLLAERDLWETRYRMAKGALRTAAYIDHPMGTEIRNKWGLGSQRYRAKAERSQERARVAREHEPERGQLTWEKF